MKKNGSWLQVLALISAGVFLGLGIYAFQYAGGLSYLSNDPKACVNCHVMNENYRSWQMGPHHEVASCNDCHIPHHFPAKFLAKAENGWNHSVKFTLGNYKKPIEITPVNLARLRENCVRCHGAQIDRMEAHPVKSSDGVNCTECHAAVGHMEN